MLSIRRSWKWAIGACMLAGALGGGALFWHSVPVPPADGIFATGTPRVLDRSGVLLAAPPGDGVRARFPIALDEMGRWLPQITVALEDRRYRSHAGVDARAVLGAIAQNARARRVVRGGSTITQQLVKLSGPAAPRTFGVKLREAVAACKLEQTCDKDRILEAYLNRLPYGNRLEGPAAAARWYFDKTAAELSLGEAIFLAGIPQAPSRLNPWRRPAAAEAKFRRSVARLRASGFLETAQARRLLADPPRVGRTVPENLAPHFVAAALRTPGVMARDGSVRTTLDLGMQRTSASLVRLHLGTINRHDISNAAVVVIDNRTGEVRAMVGSRDPARWQVNAAMAPRPAGSVLKPFVYAEAIERRVLTAATLLPDTPDACGALFPDYQPRNFSPVWHGPVRVREALGNSLNVPAVVALSKVGPRRAHEALVRWGLRFPNGFDRYGAGLVLGNAEVSLLDLAGAYAGLARGGLAQAPVLVQARRGPMERRVSAGTAAILADILCDNSARLLSFGPHSVLDLPGRVAVKTGTSSHFRDGWTAGFTAEHTVAVWVGNMDGRVMDEAASVDAAAPLWAAVIRAVCGSDAGVPPPGDSAELESATVDALTGLLADGDRAAAKLEWFLKGTAPLESADTMWRDVEGVLRPTLPPEYAQWCASGFNRMGAVAAVRASGIEIESPRDGAVYRITEDLTAGQQRIPLVIRGGSDADVEWRVNGRALAVNRAGAWWALERGEWEFLARTSVGELRSLVVVE